MLDIHNLERRWLKYKIKSYFPYAAAFIVVLFLILIGSIWIWSKKTNPPPLSRSNAKQPTHTPAPLTKRPETVAQNDVVLEPSMEFVQALSEKSQIDTSPSDTANVPGIKPVNHVVASIPPPPVPKSLAVADSQQTMPKVQPMQSSKTMLSVNRNESPLDILEVQQRFKETSNPTLGLFIARYYYDHGDYSEAYNYALKTNAINSRIDESWIIFSKSLVKLGKTDQAKKTLQLYISQSGSDTAKALLDLIEKGSFK